MAASTSNSSFGSYQVFISHRGLQMKLGFANHLYHALDARGIRPFLDIESLRKGHDVREDFINSARQASIHVPIFTKIYGTSEWCLDELVVMMDCKRNSKDKVIPVYFDVEPEELRELNGAFAENLKDYLQNCKREGERIERWKDALQEASWLDGFRLEAFGG